MIVEFQVFNTENDNVIHQGDFRSCMDLIGQLNDSRYAVRETLIQRPKRNFRDRWESFD